MNQVKDILIFPMFLLVLFYFTVNFGFIIIGIKNNHNECSRPVIRADYIAPGLQIGCWLGKEP